MSASGIIKATEAERLCTRNDVIMWESGHWDINLNVRGPLTLYSRYEAVQRSYVLIRSLYALNFNYVPPKVILNGGRLKIKERRARTGA